jgi:hypothetical protein
MEIVLMTRERKIMGKIYWSSYENGSWRVKMNQEIYKFKSPDIVTLIEVYIGMPGACCKNGW